MNLQRTLIIFFVLAVGISYSFSGQAHRVAQLLPADVWNVVVRLEKRVEDLDNRVKALEKLAEPRP